MPRRDLATPASSTLASVGRPLARTVSGPVTALAGLLLLGTGCKSSKSSPATDITGVVITQGLADAPAGGTTPDTGPAGSLTLTLPDAANEDAGSVQGTLTLSRSLSLPLAVTLTSSDASEATVPLSVTVPAGATNVAVTVSIHDDAQADGNQTVIIAAAAPAWGSVTRTLLVRDRGVPPPTRLSAALTPASVAEHDGSSVLTISLDHPTTSELTVALSANLSGAVNLPAHLRIPAGASSATTAVTAIDDDRDDGDRAVTIAAAASGLSNGSAILTLIDDDPLPGPPTRLSLSSSANRLREGLGSAIVRVQLDQNAEADLTVNLLSSPSGQLSHPAQAIIPAGSRSVEVAVSANDDTADDNDVAVTLSATAAGLSTGSVVLTALDNDVILPPTQLALSLAQPQLLEGSDGTLTVTLDQPALAEITVHLSSSDAGEAAPPAILLIPAGSSSASLAVAAVDDGIIDGNQSVTLAATAAGLTGDQLQTLVRDGNGAPGTFTIQGRLADGAAPGARVRIQLLRDSGAGFSSVATALTDADGTFVFGGLAGSIDEYRIEVRGGTEP